MKGHDRDYCHLTGQIFRRPKERPCDDFWHTIRVGVSLAALILAATATASLF